MYLSFQAALNGGRAIAGLTRIADTNATRHNETTILFMLGKPPDGGRDGRGGTTLGTTLGTTQGTDRADLSESAGPPSWWEQTGGNFSRIRPVFPVKEQAPVRGAFGPLWCLPCRYEPLKERFQPLRVSGYTDFTIRVPCGSAHGEDKRLFRQPPRFGQPPHDAIGNPRRVALHGDLQVAGCGRGRAAVEDRHAAGQFAASLHVPFRFPGR